MATPTIGESQNTLTVDQMPAHSHEAKANADVWIAVNNEPVKYTSPKDSILTTQSTAFYNNYDTGQSYSPLGSKFFDDPKVSNVGHQQPMSNEQPSMGMSFIVCIDGRYPSRD